MKNYSWFSFVSIALFALFKTSTVTCHGMMLDPPGRSSRWRFNSSAPVNYNDNQLFCGGFGTQWSSYGGKCGLCGDSYGLTPPRPNELGGYYGGSGIIVKTYIDSSTAEVQVEITANHFGYIYFNLCNLDEFNRVESEECFEKYRLRFADGKDKYDVGTTTGSIVTEIEFPEGMICDHCVLRWTYNTGNNWGVCEDGSGAVGCGPQENFKSCADISIKASSSFGRVKHRKNILINDLPPELPPDLPLLVEE